MRLTGGTLVGFVGPRIASRTGDTAGNRFSSPVRKFSSLRANTTAPTPPAAAALTITITRPFAPLPNMEQPRCTACFSV